MNKLNKKIKLIKIALILLIVLVPVLALFHSGYPITHDGNDHIARIANFYLNLSQGIGIPVWAPNLNWGYGHPILEFLYPLPSYIASFLHFLGINLIDSVKIVFGLGLVLSFVFMYIWLSQFVSKAAALLGACLYLYAPYRFVEVYVRGDIGENLAFAFIPLTFYCIYKLYKTNNSKWINFGSIALALLILSHNAISLMVLPVILVYQLMLLYFVKFEKRQIIYNILLLIFGFGLSAFFWVPALLEGKYTLRNIVTAGSFKDRFVTIQNLIYSPWSYGISGQFSVQYGLLHWISILSAVGLLFKFKKNKEKLLLLIIFLLFTLIATFLMIPESSLVWSKIMLLQNFQFPWRFLALVVLCTSVLGSLVFDLIPKKFSLTALSILLIILLLLSINFLKPKGYNYNPESYYTGVFNGTTDTGESSPIWSVRFMEKRPKSSLEVIDGHAKIKELKRLATYHKYNVDVLSSTLFMENTLYFPGWKILVDGAPVNIQFQNMTYRGVMLFNMDKGQHTVVVEFGQTRLRLISEIITLIFIVFTVLGMLHIFVKHKHT